MPGKSHIINYQQIHPLDDGLWGDGGPWVQSGVKVKPVAGRLNHSCYGELELSSWSNQLRHVGQSGSHTEESDVETRGRKRGREKEGGRKRESGSKRVQKRKTVREEKREVIKKIIKQDEIRNISSNKEYTNSEGGLDGGGGLDLNVLHNQFCLIYFSFFNLSFNIWLYDIVKICVRTVFMTTIWLFFTMLYIYAIY